MALNGVQSGQAVEQYIEPAVRAQAAVSRLQELLDEVSRAVEEGRYDAALRSADCAVRIAPDHPACLLIQTRLLVRLGAASEAIQRLRGREEPEVIVARGEALCTLGWTGDAAACCEMLLRRRAVDSVDGLQQLAAQLCLTSDNKFAGWVGVDTRLRLVGQVSSGGKVSISCEGKVWSPTVIPAGQNDLDSFTFEVPAGVSGRLRIYRSDSELLGSGQPWPPEFGVTGWVVMEDRQLVGEVKLDWAPTLPVTLAIGPLDGKHVLLAGHELMPESAGWRFSVAVNDLPHNSSHLEVGALLANGKYTPLIGSPVEILPTPSRPVGAIARQSAGVGLNQKANSQPKVDIVVPVYAGRDETLLCLKRVLATTASHEAELVVINDASPDSELKEALDDLARDGRITLLTNRINLGFPGAANKGINLHSDRDIVLLNADAEPFGNWLERLKFAAYASDDIGTVTPFGEDASITSYPGKVAHNYTSAEGEEIDRIASQVNRKKVVELPVGVGFCLYIKRSCLVEIGGFDERSFDKGYGEENDFCLRARAQNWRHVAATDLFVRHSGARSYGPLKRTLMERNRRVLYALHPGYETMIAEFMAADPLLDARRAIDMHRLLGDAREPVLLVTADLPGGVKRHINDRQSALSTTGVTVLVLRPARIPGRGEHLILKVEGQELENLIFKVPEELPVLFSFLNRLQLSHIELHHFVGIQEAALEGLISLGIRYDVYIHDYSWICPRLTLSGENGGYCGEPPIEACESCVRQHGSALEKSLTVNALRTRSARILHGANSVIVPTNDVRHRLMRYFPGLSIQMMAWEKPHGAFSLSSIAMAARLRVVVIGAISIPKGFRVLLDCARDAAERNLALEFIVIGYTCDDEALLATKRVFITGPYADSEVPALLEREWPHVAFFPSIIPETWCYTLSHAIARGLPIVGFDLGAIAERVRTYPAAELLPLSAAAADINNSLLRLARKITISDVQKELHMDSEVTTNNEPVASELMASVQVLTLPVGTYAFTVQGGASPAEADEDLILPALQVGLAPVNSPGTIEFVAGATTLDRWLARSNDIIIAKISGGNVSLLLTSLRSSTSSVLAIDVRRIDAQPSGRDPEFQMKGPDKRSEVLPIRVVAHVQNIGDLHFSDDWIGCLGDRLWIEAFAVLSVGELGPGAIEYCAVYANGTRTPWLSNQMLCGSRGRFMPIVGCAIRLKSEFAERYECWYSARFVSGNTSGPFMHGELCRSDVPGDPLWGFELRVAERALSGTRNELA
ncbi:MAG: glycosyltransferase [Deltaproteobacteria bacterium]|nr:glycosyltransferase [Deltaproteobacteria bacterium]